MADLLREEAVNPEESVLEQIVSADLHAISLNGKSNEEIFSNRRLNYV